ncbi:tellurite resistance TerB family protein [Telmatospirillum sp. J64-1]|uniref:tellurite resistance TerB family protein n=1 Tax=Telmatospirillum sp. J64-1 TaxID=2502183 RepID=UPI00115E801A|nr:tellurite resistance TerB family protein [Telmatospirillum sp. J64-1]
MLNHHTALIYTMVLTAAADQEVSDAELRVMSEIVSFLPIFRDYDRSRLSETALACTEMLSEEDGLERALDMIDQALPQDRLRDTAYALACDVAAANGFVSQEELRLLEMIRHHLGIERLVAAAIERGVRARFALLDK